jgi:cation transport ATPase
MVTDAVQSEHRHFTEEVAMSTDTEPVDSGEGGAPRNRHLPVRAVVYAGVLLAIPLIALALVPTYSSETPKLWGWPFFYWYQVLWVLLTPIFTWGAYLVIVHARRAQRERTR